MERINAPFDGLIRALAPAQRRLLAKDIAFALRSMQAQRIQKQQNPDGSDYEPRKPQRRVRRQRKKLTMFNKLRTMRYLKRQYSSSHASTIFAKAARIASVHQFGLESNVGRGIKHRYAKRGLVGHNDESTTMVEEKIFTRLSEGFSS